MQNLRDQLLKAGLITEEQRSAAEARATKDRDKRKPRNGENKKSATEMDRAPSTGEEPSDPQRRAASRPKLSRKELMKQPVNRMLDLSDPGLLKIFQAIEEHRVRDNTTGDVPFHFTLRDGHVRKISLKPEIVGALERGEVAIVENGQHDRHTIVASDAVSIIRQVDPEAVRFSNAAGSQNVAE
jgi:uncharacterized protein YaiL (DUF2058 family)